jgi:O-antigen ligase
MSGGGMALVGGLLVAIALTLVIVLDYQFNQPTHRVLKIVAGGLVGLGVLFKPFIGLFLYPIVVPFLPWIPPIPVPGMNALNLLLGGVFLAWATRRVLSHESVVRPSRLGAPILALVVVAALSVVRGAAFPTGYRFEGLDAGLETFRSAVTLSVYFITLWMARGSRDRRVLAWAVVLGLLAEGVTTLLLGRNGSGGRAIGSMGQANELGTYLALYAVLAASLMAGVKNLFGRMLLAAATVAGCVGIVFTVSRGALLAVVLGLLFVGLRTSRLLTMVLLVVLATGPLWAPDYLKQRLMGTQVEVEGTDETELEGSAQLRIDTWSAVMKVITEHPIEGVGFGGLKYILPEAGNQLGLEVKDSSHNTYLRVLAEMGIFGLGLFVWLLWRCWKLAMDGARAARTRFDRQLSVGLAGATLALAASCAFGDRFFTVLITGPFWVLCALVDDVLQERRGESA